MIKIRTRQGGFLPILVGLLVLVVAGVFGGYYVFNTQDELNVTDVDEENKSGQNVDSKVSSNTEVQETFPWADYPATVEVQASTVKDVVVARTVKLGTNAKTRIVVAETLDLGTGAMITGKAFIFSSVDMGTNSRIEDLALLSSTNIDDAVGSKVINKETLKNNDLVASAKLVLTESAAGQNTGTGVNTSVNITTNNTQQSSGTNFSYTGNWKGSFDPNLSSRADGCLAGAVAIAITNSGNFQGPLTTLDGDIFYGGGTVSANGVISGGWSVGGEKIAFNGQLGASSGSGTYKSGTAGCSGNFSLLRY
ncbi:MAG TPA: hypothetical protein VJI73_01350 [Candidatus Paceibacterota bacterium]